MRARVADIGGAQCKEAPTFVETEFQLCHQVAALVIADETLRSRRPVLDRPAELARGPEHQAGFDIDAVAGTEIAAHVIGQHADLVGIDAENVCKLALLAHRSAAAGIDCVALMLRCRSARRRHAAPSGRRSRDRCEKPSRRHAGHS